MNRSDMTRPRRMTRKSLALLTCLGMMAGTFEAASAAQGQEPAPKPELTKEEKAARAEELAPTMTAMLANPAFPSTDSLNVNVELVIYMGGFHLATTAFDTAFSDTGYQIRSTIKTRGLIDALAKTDAVIGARGDFIDGKVRPLLYNSDITDKKQRQLVSLSFARENAITLPQETLSFPEYNLDKYPVTALQRRQTVDPMSAIMQVIQGASLDSQNPCGGTIPVFDGRRRFNFILEHAGTENISTGKGDAWEGEAIKCWLGFERIAGYKPRKKGRSARRDGRSEWPDVYMWLAPIKGADRQVHIPVRFFAETGFGAVIVRAVKLEVSEAAPKPVTEQNHQASVQTAP